MFAELLIGTLAAPFSTGPASGVQPVGPADLFVDATADCTSGLGTPDHPFCSIGAAVGVAVNGDVIRVAAGTYTENLSLHSNVALIGTDGQSVTTIDGGLNGTVVTVTTNADVSIDGVTITGGSNGGVINRGSLLLSNSTVSGNNASLNLGGGGIYHDHGAYLTLSNVTVSGNNCMGVPGCVGGGLHAFGPGPVHIEHSRIVRNHAISGGGIHSFCGNTTIIASTIAGNTANYGGGALLDSTALVVNSTFSANEGGGITFLTCYFAGTSLALRSSTIHGNDGGGLTNATQYAVSIGNSVVSGNVYGLNPDDLFGPFTSTGFNFIGASAGFNGLQDGVNGDQVGLPFAPIDALLGPLRDNGGVSLTHQALPGSPLIGTGDQIHFEPVDQRGMVRVPGYIDVGSTEDNNGNLPGCSSAPNSTGSIGTISTSGSARAADDNFVLTMSDLPTNQFGAFLVAPQTGFIANPAGSTGHLCLGGSIGRFFFPGQITGSGVTGSISLRVPLTMLPQGAGFVGAQASETWFFQGWHRDVVAGASASNFSSAIGVHFQ